LYHDRRIFTAQPEAIKKTAQPWRVSGHLFAYAHEPAQTTNPPEKPKTKTKPRKSKTYANNKQL
jgi:hypothetical protein